MPLRAPAWGGPMGGASLASGLKSQGAVRATGPILTTTLDADVRDDIAGYAICANRQDHIGRSTPARSGIHRPSASSGYTPLRAKAIQREPRQQLRLSVEVANVLFPVAANRRSSAPNRLAR
jgi:hypothetical protein